MRYLIINADGYGFTAGITRAIEECIEFGTVRSLSVNVNFKPAEQLVALVRRHPEISVGCHINPVVGVPVLPPHRVSTLLDSNGEFLYRDFVRFFVTGRIRSEELKAEMLAQIERTRDLAGKTFSHIDFHMGLHRLPGIYNLFLAIAKESRVGRIRTHRYLVGMESGFPRWKHGLHLFKSPTRAAKFAWNQWLRQKAAMRGLAMPARRVEITEMARRPQMITVANYLRMLENLPEGISEFVAHPGYYMDDELKRWSTYLEPRFLEHQVLVSAAFRGALESSDIRLAGYRDIPLRLPAPETAALVSLRRRSQQRAGTI